MKTMHTRLPGRPTPPLLRNGRELRPPRPGRPGTASGAAVCLMAALLSSALAAEIPKGAERLSGVRSPERDPARVPAAVLAPAATAPASAAPIQIRIGPYYGWERCLTLANDQVEALVVPAIGRVMRFQFLGQSSPFWEDTALRGRAPDPAAAEWLNFGGDKSWPAPQADWGRITPRSWPPPVAFDAQRVEVTIRRDTVVLTSPVDPHYGIRTERVLRLDHHAPVLTIETSYEKVEGDPVTVGVWIITQLEDPVAVYAPVPRTTRFPEGYNRQSGDALPANLAVDRNLLSLTRDPARWTKIGMDTDRLLWVGTTQMLLIQSPRVAGGDYPDQHSSAEIYTNPDPKPYVELEMLGPLRTLQRDDRLSQTNVYTLLRRTRADPTAEARRVLRP